MQNLQIYGQHWGLLHQAALKPLLLMVAFHIKYIPFWRVALLLSQQGVLLTTLLSAAVVPVVEFFTAVVAALVVS
jgi:hypothetical protein